MSALLRTLRTIDWINSTIILFLTLTSLLFVYSTTYQPEVPYSLFFKKQLFGFISGYILCWIIGYIDYRRLQRWGYFLYFVTIALLIFTLIKGSIGLGAQRWINLGIIKFQPSELIKLFFPPFFTFYTMESEGYNNSPSELFMPILMILCATLLLIMKQPDLGTAIIIGLSSLLLLATAGINRKFFYGFGFTLLITAPLLWTCLRPYQKQRILVFLGEGDRRKERYQIEQSFIAIGSGGILGKGLLCGTQNILQFLPESRTDFIFSIVCEEWGFIGALAIIILYIILFMRWIFAISNLPDTHTQILSFGLVAPIMFATVINMGMVTGLLPSVGIPLPLMSYGITHAWITLASIGFLNSILRSKAALSRS